MNKIKIVNVLLPLPFDQTFQYKHNDSIKLTNGSYVIVPFRNKFITGCVWEKKSNSIKALPEKKIKFIEKKLNITPLNKENREFIEWVSSYTMNSSGQILKLCLSTQKIFNKKKRRNCKRR